MRPDEPSSKSTSSDEDREAFARREEVVVRFLTRLVERDDGARGVSGRVKKTAMSAGFVASSVGVGSGTVEGVEPLDSDGEGGVLCEDIPM